MSTPQPTATPPVRIGTRRSRLAMVQTEGVRDSLVRSAPGRVFEIEALRTLGDKDKVTALYEFGAKSLWTSELEELLVSGKLDVVVHCLKDMPTRLPDTCELGVIPARDDPRDALVVKAGLPYKDLQSLPAGSVVGTSSVRRSAQLRRLYPGLQFANLRGNVETRLAKVDAPDGEYACMVMSAAGLQRIGLAHRITQYLGSRDGGIFHAVGQGALGLEIRKGDTAMLELLSPLVDHSATLACLAERSLMRELEGGCSVPIGVETEWLGSPEDRVLRMRAIVVSLDGSQSVENSIDAEVRTEDAAEELGKTLATRLLQAGAEAILKDINKNRPPKD
ncbi:porphobilinogen deaminase Hem3 [Lasiodiplodia theobromae]|uniref:Porphobilinogen deaminase n=1 Tax=Lasiodiplodia theobromae TaxID=45133 RepID=A0A5N5CXR7_9PEZI|nr:Porphobilinogen deaminase [Lasiodiplodia theobromae]KAB2570153.1 Porphobilinogen deaminase [Lasiodiplodia theobromae]KAF4544089.1 Porphobilinogen deaminase [Lasiodiplodia theobromae]KAF9629132.1 porphobilinogen deaminase Hem3 [Lasiodiplodia theobromae]